MAQQLNEKNVRSVGMAVVAGATILAAAVTTGIVSDIRAKSEIGRACIQVGGEWRTANSECIRR